MVTRVGLRRSGVTVLLALLLGLAACGSRRSSSHRHGGNAEVVAVTMAPQAAIAPAFAGTGIAFTPPGTMESSRISSASASVKPQLEKRATDYETEWMNNRVDATGHSAVFDPAWPDASATPDGLAYCCYRFVLGGYAASSGPQTLLLGWDPEHLPQDADRICIGLSDWTRNGWDWFAGPADDVLTIASFAPYTGPQGQVLAVVVMMGSSGAELDSLTVGQPELRGLGLAAEPRALAYVNPRVSSATLPASFDLTPGFPPIRDQGQLGSCTAFSVGDSAFGFELNRLYSANGWNMADQFNKAAPRYIYVETGFSESGLPQPPCPDNGRFLSGVFDYLKLHGASADIHEPYVAPFCDNNWTSEALADAPLLKIADWQAFAGQTANTVGQVKSVLVNDGRPVVIGLLVDQAFMDYKAGQVWDFIGPSLGGHAICVVGYDDAKQAFKVRNSWGTAWGEAGYCYISYHTFSTVTGAALTTCFSLSGTFNQAVVDRFCPPQTFNPPTGVAATDGTLTDRVRITWAAATGATSYKVFRATLQAGPFTQIGTATTLQFDDLQSSSAVFFYQVRGNNGTSDSQPSSVDAGHAGLDAPGGVAATDGSLPDRVRITWNAVAGATGYKVFRATSLTGTYVQAGTATTPTFDDLQTLATPFFYKVKSSNASGDSGLSSADGGNAGGPSIAAPTNVAATDGTLNDRVRITWKAVSGATGYKIYNSPTLSGTYTQFGSTTTALTIDNFQGVTTPRFYVVVATGTGGDSGPSTPDAGNAGLATPTNLAATDGTLADRVRLTWTAVPGATRYIVFRAPNVNGPFTVLGQPTTNTFDDLQSVTTTFVYVLRASNANGDSIVSSGDVGHAGGGTGISAPTGVTATDSTLTDRVRISWNTVAGATGYKVLRATTAAGTYSQVGTTAAGVLTFDNFIGVTTPFFFEVVASGSSADSPASAPDAGNAGLATPTNLAATDGTLADRVRLTWTAVPGATKYKVFRAPTVNGTYTLIGQPTTNTFDDLQSVTTTFVYVLRASNANGDSIVSSGDVGHAGGGTGFSAPTGVTATDGTLNDRVRISWNAVAGATGYKVLRATTAAGTYSQVGTTAAGVLTFDNFLGVTTPFFFEVVASSSSADSPASAPDAGHAGLATPTGLAATDGTLADRVRLTWTAVPGATSYKVFRAPTVNGTYTLIGQPTAATFDDLNGTLTPSVYVLRATNASGDSIVSSGDLGFKGGG